MNFQKAGNVSVVHQVRDVLERLGPRTTFGAHFFITQMLLLLYPQ